MFKHAAPVLTKPASRSYRSDPPSALESLAKSLESANDPAFAVDGEGRIIAWNSAAEAALGHSRGRVLGKPCYAVVRGTDTFGNPVCQRECLVLQGLRESKPVRRFRMCARTSAGHCVETECATLQLWVSSDEAAVIHLLRLWPGKGCDPAPRRSRGAGGPRPPALRLLTPREREVLGLLAAGKSTSEMVDALGVSPATVRTHVENILRKLNVHSRLEAVAVALRDGSI
jgi:PAS domain S-box-containing protein